MTNRSIRQAAIVTVFILLSFYNKYVQKSILKMVKILCLVCLLPLFSLAQQFERIPIEAMFHGDTKIQFREIVTTSKGAMLITASRNFAEIYGGQFGMDFPTGGLTDNKGNPGKTPRNSILYDAYYLFTGFKCIAEGPGDIIYIVSDNNNFGWIDYKIGKGISQPPFNFPGNQKIDIRKIWIDQDGDLYIAASDTIYLIIEATKLFKPGSQELNFKGAVNVEQVRVRAGEKSVIVADVSAVKAATDWQPAYTLQEGLAKTVQAEQEKKK